MIRLLENAATAIRQYAFEIAHFRRSPAPRYTLAVCAIIKDEGRHLAEWLCFHRAAGVEYFLLYDNDSTDDTSAVVADFVRAFPGAASLLPWPGEGVQMRAYQDALGRLRPLARWAAFIDADEYLFGMREDLKTILADFEGAGALCVPWLNFGSSGHVEMPAGLCIENFTRRAPDKSKSNRKLKPILQPAQTIGFYTPHAARLRRGRHAVNEKGAVLCPDNDRDETATHDRIRIHHYVVQSLADWRRKQLRGRVSQRAGERFRPDSFFAENDRNEQEDLSALRLEEGMRRNLAAVAAAKAAESGDPAY